MSKVAMEGGQQSSLLEVLKKKMRQAREEAESAKDEADEVKRQLDEERKKREDVGYPPPPYLFPLFYPKERQNCSICLPYVCVLCVCLCVCVCLGE